MIKLGDKSVKLYLGSNPVSKVYLGSALVYSAAPVLNARTQAVVNYATAQGYAIPTSIDAMNTFIGTINSVLDKLDLFYLFSGTGTAQFKCINIVTPTKYNGTPAGGMTWEVGGAKGNISNSYIDTNFNPTTAVGANYVLNSASRFAHVSTAVGTTFSNGAIIDGANADAVAGGTPNTMYNYNFDGQRINNGVNKLATNANTNSAGFKALTRNNNAVLFMNNDSIGNFTLASTALYNSNQFIMRASTSYSGCTLGMYGLGGYLTQAELNLIKSAYNTYINS